jgi:hypothetical protein
MSSRTNGFAQGTVLKVAYSMLGLTSSVILARVGLNILRPKSLTAPDYFVFLAFSFYAIMCALYISVSPYMQRVYGVINGDIAPYAHMAQDTVVMTKMIFAAPCMFWLTLWSIKISLLLLYRRLLMGLHRCYTIIWWAITGLCVVVSLDLSIQSGCSIRGSHLTDICGKLHLILPVLRYYIGVLDGRMRELKHTTKTHEGH